MQGCHFDQELSEGLELMTESRWVEAAQVLEGRLRRLSSGGHKRLNLFLLAISVASSGQSAMADKLWEKAQQAPLGDLTTRYLDLQLLPNDPRQSVLWDLERAWWNFNGWNNQTVELSSQPAPVDVDWEVVVDGVKSGDTARLERLYHQGTNGPEHESSFLWNFLALSYLEAGNVRSYEEMAGNAPSLPAPNSVPLSLARVLQTRGLEHALECLNRGEWLDYSGLSQTDLDRESSEAPVTEQSWSSVMEDGFAMLDLGHIQQACRSFQQVAASVEHPQKRLLSLNALSLAFFRFGDYTQSETLFLEFQNLLQDLEESQDEQLLDLYRRWLESVQAAPGDGGSFFSPFSREPGLSTQNSQESGGDFWESLSQALQGVAGGDLNRAKRTLQALESSPRTDGEEWKLYLVTLTYLAGAVVSGDHFEIQEFEQELANLQFSASFSDDQRQEAKDLFRWIGFEQLGPFFDNFQQGRPGALNPWQDLQWSGR